MISRKSLLWKVCIAKRLSLYSVISIERCLDLLWTDDWADHSGGKLWKGIYNGHSGLSSSSNFPTSLLSCFHGTFSLYLPIFTFILLVLLFLANPLANSYIKGKIDAYFVWYYTLRNYIYDII